MNVSIRLYINLLIILTLCLPELVPAQGSDLQKFEFRGAWVATVTNLDWPTTPGLHSDFQKNQLRAIFDNLKASGINAVIFQIRTECDALYASSYEPWSYWLTAEQGKPPEPFYDPLEFAIEEAHKRGMELHAWLNPYRAIFSTNYQRHASHVSNAHPDWILTIGTYSIINPGLPEVRQHILNVVEDVVSRYDIDGIHMDDYFYPYPPNTISNEDAATFAEHNRGFTNIHDWRRDNINLLMREINDLIADLKPHIKFGMSPFGIWKNGVPPGITGLDAYSTIYCDAIAWLQDRSVDYITPQLYWPFGGGQDYGKLMPWWADSAAANDRHLYVGHAAYRISGWTNSEMPNQVRANRNNPNCQGSVFFRAASIQDNPRGFNDSLKTDLYRFPAISPVMDWKDRTQPDPPANLRYDRIAGTAVSALQWDNPGSNRFVLYGFPSLPIPGDLENPENIIDISGTTVYHLPDAVDQRNYFSVSALSRNSIESITSEVIEIPEPHIPFIVSPGIDPPLQRDTVNLVWNYAEHAASYALEVSENPDFTSSMIVNIQNMTDTSYIITDLVGQETYFWRVRSHNPTGSSDYSPVHSFTTGFPVAPTLASPATASQNLPLTITFEWNPEPTAESYRFMLGKSRPIIPERLVLDSIGVADTFLVVSDLEYSTIYFWQVSALNEYGQSEWSPYWALRTAAPTSIAVDEEIPDQYLLSQNYPNPFNPSTQIRFQIPEATGVILKVYDMLGREVGELVNDYLSPGTYTVTFDAAALPSGMYIYQLRAGSFVENKRMIFVK
jgi:uncharacterized lipoprotein YddW (UPF0748 family)